MAVNLVKKEFSRVGRKTEGEEAAKYIADQLSDDSIASDSTDAFLTDVLEVCGTDLKLAAEDFRTGANQHLRLAAGGYTPEEKAAKALMKAMPAVFAGRSLEEVVAQVKAFTSK
jgi:hypothetical protein